MKPNIIESVVAEYKTKEITQELFTKVISRITSECEYAYNTFYTNNCSHILIDGNYIISYVSKGRLHTYMLRFNHCDQSIEFVKVK